MYNVVCTSVCVCRCRWDDGVLAMMAVTSAFHMAYLQVGLSSPIRLGNYIRKLIRLVRLFRFQLD